MRRWDIGIGGLWLRLGRYWYGVLAAWPLFYRVPVIAGGSEAQAAQGSYLVMGDGLSPEVFTEIAEVTSIGGPSISRERIDVTHLRSPGFYREFLASFIDPGTLPFTIQYNPTAHATHNATTGLAAKLNVSTNTNFKLVFPDASSWDMAATLTGWDLAGMNVGGKIEINVVLSISGEINFNGTGSP